MSQVHRKLAEHWLAACERKERPALTIWETEQLLRGWLAWDAAIKSQPSPAHVHTFTMGVCACGERSDAYLYY